MDGNGCRYGRWWGRRGLLLAGMAVLGFRLRLGLRCALQHIDDDLYSSSESSGPVGSWGKATRRRCLPGLVLGVIYSVVSPFCTAIRAALQASDCVSRSRTFGHERV